MDTHVFVWLISGDKKLGLKARGLVETAVQTGTAALSTASIFELSWLHRRGRLPFLPSFEGTLRNITVLGISIAPIDVAISVKAASLTIETGDPMDRFIAAAAIEHSGTLCTADERLLAARLPCPVLDARF